MKKDLICKFLQSGSLYACIKCFVYMQYYYKAHRNFTLLDSVILLFFSKTMKKRHYLQVLFATLQSGSVQYVLNVLFTFSITLGFTVSPIGIAILLLLDF